MNSDKKIYLYDTGFYGTHKHSVAKDFGKLLECYVFAELCRHGLRPNISLFSYQTKSRLEVDFFIPASRQDATLIQVCYSMTNIETRQRERWQHQSKGETPNFHFQRFKIPEAIRTENDKR